MLYKYLYLWTALIILLLHFFSGILEFDSPSLLCCLYIEMSGHGGVNTSACAPQKGG